MSLDVQATKSFLEDVVDGLTWDKEEDKDYSSDSSSDDDDSSDEEDEDGMEEDDDDGMEVEPPPPADNRHDVAQNAGEQPSRPQQAASPPFRSANADTVLKNLRAHPRSQELLFRVAQSEETPLLSSEIDWDLLTSQLKTYPAAELGDEKGGILLQNILRMDPPAFVVHKAVAVFPKACVDMRAFYAACQYGYQRNDDVVELVMHHTLEARRKEGIQWGMLAFLGDARVRTRHARILLKGSPTAVIDPDYGVHGVSPLDRMLSGALIHGDDIEWVEKLKLALLTAKFGSVDSAVACEQAEGKDWFPFHTLIRRITSKDFMGVKFGKFTFIRTLSACLRSGFSCQNVDTQGNLPVHTALERVCNTNLGTAGERKLIKFLLQAHPAAATTRSGSGILPLRLSIQNGWPVYDILVDSSPSTLHTKNDHGNIAIHKVFQGKYHPSFGIKGARGIAKYILREYPRAANIPDGNGRLPIHLAMEQGWPCHDLLAAAAPRALETRDLTNGLYPFQIAACALQTSKEDDKETSLRELSMLFELIRYRPVLTQDKSFGAFAKSGNGKQKAFESFLEDISDKDDIQDEDSVSSSDDDDSSDEEDDAIEQQPRPPVVDVDGEPVAQNPAEDEAVDEDPMLPYQPTNTASAMESLRDNPRSEELIFRVARSGETPLVRGDIDWDLLTSQIKTYPAAEVGDERGSALLQGILRMDPPSYVVQKAVAVFPKSCLDMEAFYAACQYGSHHNDDVVELVMHHTLEARRKEGIQWGMLAFLGDARVRTRHARILLKGSPTAVIDPDYGMFGVSPLDRMLSGALIHGDDIEWVEKLKLALLTAKFGSVDSAVAREDAGGSDWFPFHTLIRRITSKDFMGVKFGKFTFIRTLKACLRSGFSCQKVDRKGNLPVHTALERECNTNLGAAGERKLIKFLLQAHPDAATTRSGCGILPLRLSIQNGWPVYDILVEASPKTLYTRNDNGNLAIHKVFQGKYHPRFGIKGARDIAKYILKKYPKAAGIPDGKGRLPLHLAMENRWPCHDLIMAAAPRALETRDLTSRFYPFQIAACALQTSEEDDKEKSLRELSMLFELIGYGPPALTRGFGHDMDKVGRASEENGANGASRKRKRSTATS